MTVGSFRRWHHRGPGDCTVDGDELAVAVRRPSSMTTVQSMASASATSSEGKGRPWRAMMTLISRSRSRPGGLPSLRPCGSCQPFGNGAEDAGTAAVLPVYRGGMGYLHGFVFIGFLQKLCFQGKVLTTGLVRLLDERNDFPFRCPWRPFPAWM